MYCRQSNKVVFPPWFGNREDGEGEPKQRQRGGQQSLDGSGPVSNMFHDSGLEQTALITLKSCLGVEPIEGTYLIHILFTKFYARRTLLLMVSGQ